MQARRRDTVGGNFNVLFLKSKQQRKKLMLAKEDDNFWVLLQTKKALRNKLKVLSKHLANTNQLVAKQMLFFSQYEENFAKQRTSHNLSATFFGKGAYNSDIKQTLINSIQIQLIGSQKSGLCSVSYYYYSFHFLTFSDREKEERRKKEEENQRITSGHGSGGGRLKAKVRGSPSFHSLRGRDSLLARL